MILALFSLVLSLVSLGISIYFNLKINEADKEINRMIDRINRVLP